MDYQKHYDLLCERARNRLIEEYTERHHVIPRCMGGDDSPENLVDLTPEEHYVAHQLLVKMYPDHKGLVWAAHQMTKHSTESVSNERSRNKLYGWLRKKNQKVAKERKGKNNGSHGKSWYYHPETLENVKCSEDEVPEGYIRGRVNTWNPRQDKKNTVCHVCGKDTGSLRRKFCSEHLTHHQRESARRKGFQKNNRGMTNKLWITDGTNNKHWPKSDPIPVGYCRGRTIGAMV